ncbi:VOC family protein [Roseibium alexandrii]|uniref:Putative lactoylglutathione lyase n=1 Tax=Roseibium alexandrii (strain DSM 17067 / NCIMB 14079 / DFL-11) TaxID=244592 RepID=A0A5E8H563_ROSAD|nr:VOC family protein [Roseibium alexandrii]EEE47215.1 putative lactoylglutathione lyase [Roseibium alexandrii DFL-11]
MQLGAFSISLTVKDLAKSKAFYEGLGFSDLGGSGSDGWVIMKNGETVIGLFQDMFEKNILTFNPGWDQDAKKLDAFTDIRALQKTLKDKGYSFVQEVDETTTGPGSLMLLDPDGNPILIDQHV